MAKPSLMATRVGWIKIRVEISRFVKIVGRRPIPDAVCISKPWPFSNYCTLYSRNRLLSETRTCEKSWLSARQNAGHIFHRLWANVEIGYSCTGVIVVCNALFRLTISYASLEIFAINSQSCQSQSVVIACVVSQICNVFLLKNTAHSYWQVTAHVRPCFA